MKILVTGSEGTLGKPLVDEIKRRGHSAMGIDMAHTGKDDYARCDIRNYRQLENVFETFKPDVVYALAAEFGRASGEGWYEQLYSTNQIGTQHTIELCLKHKAKFILAGSSEAYGDSFITFKEDEPPHSVTIENDGLLREEDLSKVNYYNNQYSSSKYLQEIQTYIAVKNRGLQAVVCRFFNAYGPGEFYTPYRSVVSLFCYRLLHDMPITVYRDYHRVFQFIGDFTPTLMNVAERFETLPAVHDTLPIVNIGGSEYRSVEELVEIIKKQIPQSKSVITVLDKEKANVQNKRPSIEIAKKYLGHNPVVTLEEGVKTTVSWMREYYKVP